MHLKLLRWVVTAALLTTTLAGPVSADPAPSTVRDWNRHAATALMSPPTAAVPGAAQSPTVAILHLAMVQGAVYDAVNAIAGGYEPYLGGLSSAPSTASQDAAAATAAHHVLVGLVPSLPAATLNWIEAEYSASMSAISALESAANVAAGAAIGSEAAAAMLAARTNDGRYPTTPFNFRQGTEPGEWRPTATEPPFSDPFAWVANVEPFAIRSASQFRSDGPLPLTSAAYAAEYNEVKALGARTGSTRTDAQTALAMFYTLSPPELFNRTFRGIAEARGLSTAEEARLFAMVNIAGADGLISCWNDKAYWSFWRPMTAIRIGDDDGNPATDGDETWTPLVANPPYPEHPSGYNCATSSMIHSAVHFFGTKKIRFTVQQTPVAGSPVRNYSRLTDVIKDTIDSRLYLGIHFRTPDVQGAIIGKQVARFVDKHHFGAVD